MQFLAAKSRWMISLALKKLIPSAIWIAKLMASAIGIACHHKDLIISFNRQPIKYVFDYSLMNIAEKIPIAHKG